MFSGDIFILDRVNALLNDELMKATNCSEQSILVYQIETAL
jgi:hypothetical protein